MRFYLGHRLPGGFWAGLSTYARRPHRAARQAAHATGGIGCVGFVALAVILALAISYWYVSVPVLLLTAVAVGVTVHRRHVQRAGLAAGTPAPTPQAVLSPNPLAFPGTLVGTAATALPMTLSNPGAAALAITGISAG